MNLNRSGFTRFAPSLRLLGQAFLLTLGASAAWSQATSNATLAGQVTDEQGAVVVGAEIRIVDAATASVQSTISNETGRYVIANLTPGTYQVNISKAGFTVFKISAQKIDVGTTVTINAPLRVGSTTTTVEVAASVGAELQTTNATVGSTL